MTSAPEKIAQACWRLVPARLENKLRTEAGIRFTRFILVALTAVVTSQVVLGLLTGPVNWSAGASGVIASMVAALVSYVLSRWAWERKGRPDLLRETLPFWAVSVAVWVILGLTSHYASVWAHSMGYTHFKKHLVVQGAYLLMNCVTFVGRFLIFHYVLFANKDKATGAARPASAPAPASRELAGAEAGNGGSDTGPMAVLVPGDSGPPPRR
jgi:putative flippase GtrA